MQTTVQDVFGQILVYVIPIVNLRTEERFHDTASCFACERNHHAGSPTCGCCNPTPMTTPALKTLVV
ncbi:hypothetical protein [Streptomyces sp. H27-D2]|uniref:hypothetical protein n=1 Tax=Streptomyces sp. H27-D2 TaxID=3046304 RepID=UPI002DBD655D|nr:hypothetical protein [Streptomyces sp. H27-D2]MEC4019177.1 hypothetical protein [Streptomyces sp. H27-D2]